MKREAANGKWTCRFTLRISVVGKEEGRGKRRKGAGREKRREIPSMTRSRKLVGNVMIVMGSDVPGTSMLVSLYDYRALSES